MSPFPGYLSNTRLCQGAGIVLQTWSSVMWYWKIVAALDGDVAKSNLSHLGKCHAGHAAPIFVHFRGEERIWDVFQLQRTVMLAALTKCWYSPMGPLEGCDSGYAGGTQLSYPLRFRSRCPPRPRMSSAAGWTPGRKQMDKAKGRGGHLSYPRRKRASAAGKSDAGLPEVWRCLVK